MTDYKCSGCAARRSGMTKAAKLLYRRAKGLIGSTQPPTTERPDATPDDEALCSSKLQSADPQPEVL